MWSFPAAFPSHLESGPEADQQDLARDGKDSFHQALLSPNPHVPNQPHLELRRTLGRSQTKGTLTHVALGQGY